MLSCSGSRAWAPRCKFIPRPVVIGFTNGIAVLIASTQIKDFFGLQIDRGARRVPRSGCGRSPSTVDRSRGRGHGVAARLAVADRCSCRASPGVSRAPSSRWSLGTGGGLGRSACRSRPSARASAASRRGLPALHVPPFRPDLILPLLSPALTVAHARRHRVAAVGGRRRPHDRRPAQPERRTLRAGRRQHRLAAVRRPAGHRRDRAHGDQHPLRGADARGGDDPRADAARPSCCSRRRWPGYIPLCVLRPSCSWSPTNMGEWGRDPGDPQAQQGRHRGVGGHLRADRARRPHRGGRGRDGPGGAALHPQGGGHDHGRPGDRGVRRRRRVPTACRTRDPGRTSPSSASTGRSCSARPTSSTVIADEFDCAARSRDPAAAQHDGHRRHGPARARGPRRPRCGRRAATW